MPTTTVLVGLGSNLNPLENLRRAVEELKLWSHLASHLKNQFKLKKISSIYESDAQVLPDSPKNFDQPYLNAAVLIEINNFDPHQFLSDLKNIEKKMGRINEQRWAPREIDLDILYVDGFQFESDILNIPHKNLIERPFALLPALEIYKDLNFKTQLNIKKPNWCNSWVAEADIPFHTKKSKKYFWPEFVGILNITSDSFSDGGFYLSEDEFKKQALSLINQGADILDVGAESTRPDAVSVLPALEYERLNQALNWLKELKEKSDLKLNLKISIDSRNSDVISKILDKHEIHFINDVTGFKNPQMQNILKNKNHKNIKAVVMHSITIPPNQQEVLNINESPCQQLITWWKIKLEKFEKNNISTNNLIFDPGIGFGKTPEQNSYILNHLEEFCEIKNKIYLGFSRKSYLNQFTNAQANKRDVATAVQTSKINSLYCQYLRTHDIEPQKTALRMS